MRIRLTGPATLFLVIALTSLSLPSLVNRVATAPPPPVATTWIVEATSTELARARVEQVGGEVTHELDVIGAVAARLDDSQHQRLIELDPSLRMVRDGSVTLSTAESADSAQVDRAAVPAKIGADALHAQGIRGQGITVAVLDTGLWDNDALLHNAHGASRLLAHYDARGDQVLSVPSDENGHGTHVTGILASSDATSDARFHGVAPNVDLVTVAAFDRDGLATYADVIRGLDWIVAHRDLYDIRVLALAFSAPTQLPYWQDPLARAVMAAWREGIVVVTSAGNRGPAPKTLGVPGNVPYVITVGGVGDQELGVFSSAGPTEDAFVKPELVAPGVRVTALMDDDHEWAVRQPAHHEDDHFTMSGTSQAMAVVAGAAALVLQHDPTLTPDDVKCRLITSARPAVDADGQPAYSVFQQGAGLLDAVGAISSTDTGCANRGLDVDADLAGLEHYRGPARELADGSYVIDGGTGTWDASLVTGTYDFSASAETLSTLAGTDGTPWIDDPIGGGAGPIRLDGPWAERMTTGGDPLGGSPIIEIGQWVETP